MQFYPDLNRGDTLKDIEFAIAVLESDLDKRRKALDAAHLLFSQIDGSKEDIRCLESAIKKLKTIWESY